MTCPKCLGNDITPVGTTHYICNNPECENNGMRTQFHLVVDEYMRFPYNQIFVSRSKQEFIRQPYLSLASKGSVEV